MNISADYESVLKDSLRDELIWFEEEMCILFDNKLNCTDEEITLANQMIENITHKISDCKIDDLSIHLSILLEKLEKKYPEIF